MTDQNLQAKTVALDAAEWQSLVTFNFARLNQYLAQLPALTDRELPAIEANIQRAQALMRGWKHACGVQALQAQQSAPAAVPDAPVANGAAEPKRKGGWPKGRSRKAAQQAAVQ